MKKRYASRPKKSTTRNPLSILEWALLYIQLGWAVLPIWSVDDQGCCLCRSAACTPRNIGKHPNGTLAPNGVDSASSDEAKVRQWFKTGEHNIGIATGSESGITVVDVDISEGKHGAASWATLIEGHGEPQTLMAKTGSGGMHVLFQYNKNIPGKNNVLGEHIDVKNDKGYIVVAPSRHRSGGTYEWLNWGTPIAPWPAHFTPAQKKETRGRPRKDDWSRQRWFTLADVKAMLAVIPAEDQDLWVQVGFILGREFAQSDAAWDVYVEWADKWEGPRDANRERRMRDSFYSASQKNVENPVTIGTIVKLALEHGWAPKRGGVPIEDLLYVVEANEYLDRRTGKYWPTAAVDAAVSPVNIDGKIVKASNWLKQHALVTSLARDPILTGDLLVGVDCIDGALVPGQGRACFNQYKRATIELGDAAQAGPFLDHVRLLLNKPGDADQFLNYMAFLVQHPGVKPRFALLLAGPQGNGKDTALSFTYPAIGHWNVYPIDPSALEGGFNEHEAATLVVISEAANPQEMSKWAFNEKTKVLIAGNPDHTIVNPKYGLKFSCRRFCGVVLTTNNLASGIYIPQDDRRYDVMDTATFAEMDLEDKGKRRQYFETLYGWFYAGGDRHVAAFLHERNVTKWSPDHGQRITEAHRLVVEEGSAQDLWLLDALEELGNLEVVRTDWITDRAVVRGEKLSEINRRLPHAMGRAGYVKYRNLLAPKNLGRWKIKGKSYTVYILATATLSREEILEAMKHEKFISDDLPGATRPC